MFWFEQKFKSCAVMVDLLPKSLKSVYPFDSHRIKLKGGVSMHYINEGSGEDVLFLHGNPTWSFFFRKLILALRPDFRCIAIDHIGYGLSEKPRRYEYDIQSHINNAISFAELMKFRKFHIVAHDFGVVVALAMAERWPERISSISVLNSAAFLVPHLPFIILLFKFPAVGFLLGRVLNLFTKACLHLGAASILPPEILDGYLWPYRNFAARKAIMEGVEDIPWLRDHRSLDVLEPLCQKAFILCNKKIKFFWADDDFRYNFNVLRLWADVLPNAKYKRYPMAGHFLLEDSAEAVNDIKNFIYSAQNIEKSIFKK